MPTRLFLFSVRIYGSTSSRFSFQQTSTFIKITKQLRRDQDSEDTFDAALAKPRKRKAMMRLPTSNVEISRVGMLMAGFRKRCGGNASGGVRVWLRVLSFSAEEPEGSVLFFMTPNFM